MRRTVTILACLLLLGALVRMEHNRGEVRSDVSEGCLSCHAEVEGPDRSHPVSSFGCACCHLGNKYAFESRRAHRGMVRNPGDLRTASRTCGREGCHPEHAERVENSVMATNTGIIASLYRLWNMNPNGRPGDVPALMSATGPKSPPMDYFAKLCASCHLWRPLGTGQGEFALRGGGCSACHVVGRHKVEDPTFTRFRHAEMSMRVPMDNCVRCHNRSGRIGLTYQGKLEDDGYGTPFENGKPSRRRLSGSRYYVEIVPDVHFRAGMVCIDCHTASELMGDGRAHADLSSQLEITCEDCHSPQFTDNPEPKLFAEAVRLSGLNPHIPPPSEHVAGGRRGSPLYALRLEAPPLSGSPARPGRAVLYRKMDGEPLRFAFGAGLRPHHRLPGHERLSCQACHSPAMPQCCGCHVAAYGNATQHDKLLGRDTPVRWTEKRSFTRFETPAAAIDRNGRIMPASPCRVAVSLFDADGTYDPAGSLVAGSARAFDPHSTQKISRTCRDCHLNPKYAGLGTGRITVSKVPAFRPVHDSARSVFVPPGPPESLVDVKGVPLLDMKSGTPFNADEIARIRSTGPCLPCHFKYTDPIFVDFLRSRNFLASGRAVSCTLSGRGPVHRDTLLRDNLSHPGGKTERMDSPARIKPATN